MTVKTTATYYKLFLKQGRGPTWGLCVLGDCSPGMSVDVRRRDGVIDNKIIGKIVGKRNDVYFTTIASKEEAARLAARPKMNFDPNIHTTNPKTPIPLDDGTIPFDPPYVGG